MQMIYLDVSFLFFNRERHQTRETVHRLLPLIHNFKFQVSGFSFPDFYFLFWSSGFRFQPSSFLAYFHNSAFKIIRCNKVGLIGPTASAWRTALCSPSANRSGPQSDMMRRLASPNADKLTS